MVLDGIWDINIDWYFKFKEKLKSVSGKGLQKARGPRPALGSARPDGLKPGPSPFMGRAGPRA